MTTIAIANTKGGVGKTTTSVNLSAALVSLGYRVLLIDNDPQGHSTKAFGIPSKTLKYTLVNLMYAIRDDTNIEDYIVRCIVKTKSVHVLPSNKKLEGASARFTAERNLPDIDDLPVEFIMKRIIALCESDYDYIIIDCRTSFDILTINALAAADKVIIPVQTHYLAEEGLDDMLGTIKIIQGSLNSKLVIAGILLTMYQSRTNLGRSVSADIINRYGSELTVFEPIKYSIKVAEHPAYGMSIFEYDASNPASRGYAKLAEEVVSSEPQYDGSPAKAGGRKQSATYGCIGFIR